MNDSEGYRKRIAFFSECIQEEMVDSVLFIGCGYGFEPFHFRETHLQTLAVGVDVERRHFIKSLNKYVDLIVCDGAHLPFRNKAFSWGYCAHVLEHIPNEMLVSFIAEMGRTARRGVLVACPNAQRIVGYFDSATKERLANIAKWNILDWTHRLQGTFELHHRGFTRSELTTMLSSQFNDVECISIEYDVYVTKNTRYESIVKVLNMVRMLGILTPSHTFICRQSARQKQKNSVTMGDENGH